MGSLAPGVRFVRLRRLALRLAAVLLMGLFVSRPRGKALTGSLCGQHCPILQAQLWGYGSYGGYGSYEGYGGYEGYGSYERTGLRGYGGHVCALMAIGAGFSPGSPKSFDLLSFSFRFFCGGICLVPVLPGGCFSAFQGAPFAGANGHFCGAAAWGPIPGWPQAANAPACRCRSPSPVGLQPVKGSRAPCQWPPHWPLGFFSLRLPVFPGVF